MRSTSVALGLAAVMVLVAESRFMAQQGAIAGQGAPGPDALLVQTCVGANNTLRDFSGPNGRLRFVGSLPGQPIVPSQRPAGSASPEAAARAYLSECGSLFGLSDQATELAVRSQRRIDGNRSIVRFQQRYGGIPVIGGELVAQVDAAGNVITVAGELLPETPKETVATFAAADAVQTALESVAKAYQREASQLFASDPALWIYQPSLIGPARGPSRLVWRFEVTAGALVPIREFVLVDATTGAIALTFNQTETARNRLTYTAAGGTTLPGTLVCNEANDLCTGGDAEAVAAHRGARDAYDFYNAFHGRDSINNGGMSMISTVHYDVGYANAFWNGAQMVYGDAYGFAQADDVVGHELTHGVTQYESGLFYYYQSGAINESLSDVWGEFIDQWNGRGNDAAGVKWLMGEDVTGLGAIRNMQNPPAFSDPDRMRSPNYWVSTGDSGGVHINSGVNNKAAYLMTDGGTFNGQTVSALGMTKVARIYYEVQTNLLSSGSDYIDLYNLLYQGCQNLVGTSGISAADCTEVREATLAVEMNLEPSPGFHPDAPICTTGTPNNVFFDTLEGGAGNWTFTVPTGSGTRWGLSNSPYGPWAHSGTQYLYAADFPAGTTDARATMNNAVVIPANAFLRFDHSFEFEPSYDGGVVEYSVDNGMTWTDAGALFDHYGYTATLIGSPLTGRAAFNGSSRGYQSARLNLASLAGQSVRFRFRMGLDVSQYWGGWWVDDVRIYTCGAVQPSAAISQLWPVTGAAPGASVPLSAYVTNTGASALPADAKVWFYAEGPGFGTWVGPTSVAGLAAGQSQWYTYNWTIPGNAQPGSWAFRGQVWTDSQSISAQSSPLAFTVSPPQPSAAISAVWPVTGAQPGLTVPLYAYVSNTGVASLPAGTLVAFFVEGPGFSAWVGSTSVAGLASGAAVWSSFNWAIPGNAQTGSWRYRAQVWTSAGAISTLSPQQLFTVSPPTPSAVVSYLWPVSGARPGVSVPLYAYVTNSGVVALPGDARIWFYVDGPSFGSWVGSTSIAGLAPGASAWYSYSWTVPSVAAGSYGYRSQAWTNTGALSNILGPQGFAIAPAFTGSTARAPQPPATVTPFTARPQ